VYRITEVREEDIDKMTKEEPCIMIEKMYLYSKTPLHLNIIFIDKDYIEKILSRISLNLLKGKLEILVNNFKLEVECLEVFSWDI